MGPQEVDAPFGCEVSEAAQARIKGDGFRTIGVQENLAHDDYPLAQAGERGQDIFDSVDDDRAGHPIAHLPARFVVRVRVIPIKPRRLVARNPHVVRRPLKGRNDGSQDVVAGRVRRRRQAVEVQVRVVGKPVRVIR